MTIPVDHSADAYLKSRFIEKLVEHVFVSEVLQEVYNSFGKTAEVLRSEVDDSGYDVVIDCNGILRHIQLKASKHDGKAAYQKVNVALAKKPSGCVVWIFRDRDKDPATNRMELSYRFFGSDATSLLFGTDAGRRLSLEGLKVAKHTKGNAEGHKAERSAIRVIPKSKFQKVGSMTDLVGLLFNLP